MGSFLTIIGDCSLYPPQHGADTENYLQTLLTEVRYEQKNEESFAVYSCLDVLAYIIHAPGLIAIDCGCGNATDLRRLACLRLDDLKEFYI